MSDFDLSKITGNEPPLMTDDDKDAEIELWHSAEPFDKDSAHQRADGSWVYRKLRARELFDQIMQSTYSHAEPGVIFIDRVNSDKGKQGFGVEFHRCHLVGSVMVSGLALQHSPKCFEARFAFGSSNSELEE
jgi:hypothetical protein